MSDFGSYQDERGRRPSSASGDGEDLMRVILRNDVLHSGKCILYHCHIYSIILKI